jgi:hypothetical protein
VRELLRGGTNKMLGARRDLLAQLGYQPLLWPKLCLQMSLLSCAANLSLAFARRWQVLLRSSWSASRSFRDASRSEFTLSSSAYLVNSL